ncbi:hypothetical protein HK104_005223 [Borealophlyctis nickersoniae]|nr:hypothetical protein HK104_005223 [Borealophlyctis nickersoniae]
MLAATLLLGLFASSSLAGPVNPQTPTSNPILDPLAGSSTDPYLIRLDKTLTTVRETSPLSEVDQLRELDRQKQQIFAGVDFNITYTGKRRGKPKGKEEGAKPSERLFARERLYGKILLAATADGPKGPDGQLVPSSLLAEMQTYTKFAGAAYCSNAQITNWNCKSCASGVVTNPKYFGTDSDMQGYVAVYPARQTVLVAFRGSSNMANWIANLQFGKSDAEFLVRGAKVHGGFLALYQKYKAAMTGLLKDALAKNPGYSVTFVGHSLGGAITLLAAVDGTYTFLKDLPPTSINVFTLGIPRVGNARFAQLVYDTGLPVFRSVNYNDMVPHLPPQSFDFVHVDYEVWTNGKGEVVYCDDADIDGERSGKCGNSFKWIWEMSTQTHLVYYGLPLGSGAC